MRICLQTFLESEKVNSIMHIYGLEGLLLILPKSVRMGGLILRARCSSTANSMITTLSSSVVYVATSRRRIII